MPGMFVCTSTQGPVTIFQDDWAAGWTHFMPYPSRQFARYPYARFIAYNQTTGLVHYDRVSDDRFVLVRHGSWDPGWTHLVPIFITREEHGNEGFITYISATGKVTSIASFS